MDIITKERTKYILTDHLFPFVVIVGLVFAWAYNQRTPIDMSTLTGEAVRHEVERLGNICIRYRVYRVRSDCETTVAREMVSSLRGVHRYDEIPGPRSAQLGWDEWTMCEKVFPDAPWGEVRMRSRVTYRCNALHNLFPISINSPEIPFVIVPSPAESGRRNNVDKK